MSLSWKPCNTHVYQALPPSILWCASLRSEEVYSYREKCPKTFFVDSRHGNTSIHMRTKFHLHVLYGVQV